MATIRLGTPSATDGVGPSSDRHQQTLLVEAVFDADHSIDIDNSRGWDWIMLMLVHSASSGTESCTLEVYPWVDEEGAFLSGFAVNSMFTADPTFANGGEQTNRQRHIPMGPGASGALWDGGRDLGGYMLGPLPNRFQIAFAHTATGTLTYGITVLMGKGSMS
jgi:hypothetical protein